MTSLLAAIYDDFVTNQTNQKKVILSNLKAYRVSRNWTLAYMAALIGVSQAHLSKLENGKVGLGDRTAYMIETRLPGIIPAA